MPLYRCPTCGREGFLSIGKESWEDYMHRMFGEYHTYEPHDFLPIGCSGCGSPSPSHTTSKKKTKKR